MTLLTSLFSALPSWAVAVAFVLAVGVPAVGGLFVVHRLVPHQRRRANNEPAGPFSALVGVVFAVMLAFMAIAVWEQLNAAESMVVREASAASDVWRQAAGYPEPLKSRVRTGIRAYLEAVVNEEWPAQQRGQTTVKPWHIFEALHFDVIRFEPRSHGEQAVHQEQLKDLNTLMDQRRARLHAAGQGIDPRVWTVMVIGTTIMVVFTWFFGTDSFHAHVAMTGLFAVAIGLVLYMIAELDYPFRGNAGVPADAFREVLKNIDRLTAAGR